MSTPGKTCAASCSTYYVDEAGDGVLFGRRGRNRLLDADAHRFFMLGMVRCDNDEEIGSTLSALRRDLMGHALYASIPSMQPEAGKTARAFHAKDDHSEIRAKVMELLLRLDFKFSAVVKDMRVVRRYVMDRNRMHAHYHYHPNELYDLTVRMLFKERLHKEDRCRIVFARRGRSDRTKALQEQLSETRRKFLGGKQTDGETVLQVSPAYPWEAPCLQVADYCLWALQRCYERHEARFINALWPKVSLIHDVDDPHGKAYGTYLSRRGAPPDPEQIKNRRI